MGSPGPMRATATRVSSKRWSTGTVPPTIIFVNPDGTLSLNQKYGEEQKAMRLVD